MKNILIIESNNEIRENIAELLELKHFRILTAEDGLSGFQSAKKNTPDVIICDLMTPETAGETFLSLAKWDFNTRYIPLILFTADSTDTITRNHFSGAYKYIQKPFSEEVLMHAIHESLAV